MVPDPAPPAALRFCSVLRTKKEETSNLSPKQVAFLAAYAETGTVTTAALHARVARRSHLNWLKNETYAEAFAQAEERAVQIMETDARRRAIQGVEEPVIYQGKLQYEPKRDKYGREVKDAHGDVVYSNKPLTVRKPSDLVLMFLLKSKRPLIYRDNARLEPAGPGGAPVTITVKFQKAKDGRPVD
jgi:hypothetical protein